MKTFPHFVNALGTWFRATDMGAYFIPIFRPMVTEQNRLYPIQIRSEVDQADSMHIFLSRPRNERPAQV